MSIQGYLGNPNLKRQNSTHEYTHAELAEMLKCAKDIEYFAEKYCTIITIDKGKQLIELYDYQKDMLKLMSGELITDDKYNVVTLAPRQCGKCISKEATIEVFNTETDEHLELPIGEFHEMVKGS